MPQPMCPVKQMLWALLVDELFGFWSWTNSMNSEVFKGLSNCLIHCDSLTMTRFVYPLDSSCLHGICQIYILFSKVCQIYIPFCPLLHYSQPLVSDIRRLCFNQALHFLQLYIENRGEICIMHARKGWWCLHSCNAVTQLGLNACTYTIYIALRL